MLLRLIKEFWRANRAHGGDAVETRSAENDHDPAGEWLRDAEAWEKAGNIPAALECYRACVDTHPQSVEAHLGVANSLAALWRMEECIEASVGALNIAPRNSEIFSGVLLYHHYAANPDPRALFELHRRHAQMMSEKVSPRVTGSHGNEPDSARRLRIGYVSRNFSRHSVGYFIEPVIARHDPSRYSVYCYYTHPTSDDTTKRIAELAHAWRHVAAEDDDAVAKMIVDDRIDILVDLAGHTEFSRLGVFARKPAPVQMAWLGYPDTTGLPAIDYRITDAIADPPPRADELHTERLLRLTPAFLCYQPPQDSPAIATRPPQADVVFGSFNMLAKVNQRAIDMWARILHEVPQSRMCLKSNSLEHEATSARVLECFEARGIAASRVDLRRWAVERAEHLAAYSEIDIALDTFPYNGTTTTCEALWMGVPVVTLAGEAHMSRVGATLLGAAGLEDLVATSAEQYVGIATALAGDPARRQMLRSGMRQKLAASPLLDHEGFARELEQQLRAAWTLWCEAQVGR